MPAAKMGFFIFLAVNNEMKQIQSVIESNVSTMSSQFNLDLILLLNLVKGCPHEKDALAVQSRA